MTRIAVVGGRLQGVEAAYLARRAGWEVVVVDREADVPARGICDRFVQADVTDPGVADRLFRDFDLVLPALENDLALAALVQALTPRSGETSLSSPALLFDPRAYAISSSKLASNRLIRRLDLPRPRPWPESGFPVIIKPDRGSGSRGVHVCSDLQSLEQTLGTDIDLTAGQSAKVKGSTVRTADPMHGGWVIEEYLEGPSYSLEVMGVPGRYSVVQVTDLGLDATHDCKRVWAPTELPPYLSAAFEQESLALAAALGLRGLMDVEVILHKGKLKILEIDARMPSQTPIAVFWSSGVNIVERLGALFSASSGTGTTVTETAPSSVPAKKEPPGVVVEHLRITPERVEVCGEHIMSSRRPLRILPGFFGTTEAITDYEPGRPDWVATLIVTGVDRQDAWERREAVVRDIRRQLDIPGYLDPELPR
jgi:3-methylornithine--L-lysine ligase